VGVLLDVRNPTASAVQVVFTWAGSRVTGARHAGVW
jgi:hypothetical protein